MRTPTLLMTLLAVLLVTAAAGTAIAKGAGRDGAGEAQERRSAAHGNATDDHEAEKAHRAESKDARNASLASFRENRTAALAAFHAAHAATRASFLENKTKVLEACRAARNASASGNDERGPSEEAKCVKDGLKPLIRKAHAEHQAAVKALLEALHGARKGSLDTFRGWAHGHERLASQRDG
jgi:hypothetical protein